MRLLSEPLPALSSLPADALAELVADVEKVRSHYPMQTISHCKPGREDWTLHGPCSFGRLEGVHKVIFSMQRNYNGSAESRTGNYEYSMRRDHVKYFRRALHLPGIETVCEIGFNAGHGAAVWLEGTNVKLLRSFDLPFNAPAYGARNLSRAIYPGRIEFHDGSSSETLPPFVNSVLSGQQPPCDLWYIDGLHTFKRSIHCAPPAR